MSTKQMKKEMVEVWKGHGEVIIYNRLTGERTFLEVKGKDNVGSDYDTDFSYGGNGYQRARTIQEVLQ